VTLVICKSAIGQFTAGSITYTSTEDSHLRFFAQIQLWRRGSGLELAKTTARRTGMVVTGRSVGFSACNTTHMSMLENRKSPRKKMVLPVKLSMGEDSHLAHTLDISQTGARVGALRTQLQPGTVVSLRRGSKKADFRISWGSTARRHRSASRR
jgi:PilZ domain